MRTLADLPEGATLSLLGQVTGTPKTSLLALLRGLVEDGYVECIDGRYKLGLSAFKLGAALVANRTFPEIAQGAMDELSDLAGETVMIGILSQDARRTIYIARAEGKKAVRYIAKIGEERPANASAGGVILLAHQDVETQEKFLADAREGHPTPATFGRLGERLAEARLKDYSTTDLEPADGVSGIAAPIRSADGLVRSALIMCGPSTRMRVDSTELIGMVTHAALEISRLLGYRPIEEKVA